jgi:hypothetical protein
VLQRILVASWCAGPRRASMHATTPLAVDCRSSTRPASACSRTTARAGQHRAGISSMDVTHVFERHARNAHTPRLAHGRHRR